MARVVAGIGSSHVPSIGPAYDMERFGEPDWKPLFDGYRPVKQWLHDEIKPDVIVFVYNDHGSDFALDRVPTFAIGVRDSYEQADEGHGERPLPPVPGDADLSWFLAQELIYGEFDMTVCQEMKLDHGAMVPLPLLFSHKPAWDIRVVPIAINVVQHPLPTARRCYRLGHAIRRAIEAYPKDIRVAVAGTGGMSHQLHGERFGHTNEAFDATWLDLIERDPEQLASLSHRDIMAEAGAEAVELIMWLVMRGAMGENVRRVHRNYYVPMTTGMGLIALQDA
ncbi:MAG TPA: class III extradiol dioxygenase family protein [Acetobacteraceae bacterium]|jgi:protocatechuate 4,5-dioxygenase beta chain|nr:class III extradiol dioxygenase family protein [Acetobacteraceae bacterium]